MTSTESTAPTKGQKAHKAGLGFLIAALAVLLVMAIIIAGSNTNWFGFAGSNTPASADINKNGKDVDPASQEVIDALTVKTASADAECKTDDNGLVSYEIGALKAVPDPRKWSDALSTPFTATDPDAIRDELQQAICQDPLLGNAWLTFYATDVRDALKASRGVDLVELNPWLKPYTKIDKVNDKAAGFIPLLNVSDPSDELIGTAIKQNGAWAADAALLNTLFDRFALAGIDARESVVNYHLVAGGLVAEQLPEVERNPNQENLPALIFILTEKGQCQELLAIGANTGDKRPELFREIVDCTPPPATGCVENCGETPPCTDKCTPPPCPPGQVTNVNGKCVTPKSGNKDDYTYPEGKPPVNVQGPADSSPPPVTTTQPGGGGVVDTPSNPPGSETGSTGSGATPPPSTPSAPLPNEGGSNDGSVGGF